MEYSELVGKLRSLDALETSLALLVAVTGFIHLYQGLVTGFQLLTLAGLGYFGGLVLFVFLCRRTFLAGAVAPYTLLQFWEYYQFYGFSFSTLAAADKTVQLLLVILATYYTIDQGRIKGLENLI